MGNFGYFPPLLFAGSWILISFIISRAGWADLVTHYQTNTAFIGRRVGIISASINSANYKNSLILKFNEDGIYLRPIILFRLFHKPILIPWKEIKEIQDKKFLFFSYKKLIVGQPFVATIVLKKSTFSKIEDNHFAYSLNK